VGTRAACLLLAASVVWRSFAGSISGPPAATRLATLAQSLPLGGV
jgi:hypothetical protein